MNSKWGNSLAIVARNVRSAWRAILSGYLGSYIQEPEGGGVLPRGISFLRGRAGQAGYTSSTSSTGSGEHCSCGRAGQAGYTSSTSSTGSGEHCSVYLCTLASVSSAVLAWALTPSPPSKGSVPRSSHFSYHDPDILC